MEQLMWKGVPRKCSNAQRWNQQNALTNSAIIKYYENVCFRWLQNFTLITTSDS